MHRRFVTPSDVDSGLGPTRRLRHALLLAFAVSFGASAIIDRLRPGQVFAVFGETKQIALPVTFVVFALALIYRARGEPPARIHLPGLWAWFMWIVVISTATSTLFPSNNTSLYTSAQGLVLFLGIGLSAALGWSAARWPDEEQTKLLATLMVGAVVSLIVGPGPFVSLAVPAAFTAALMALRSTHHRGRLWLLTVVLVALYARQLVQRAEVGSISVGVLLEIAACAAIFLVAALPRSVRGLAVVGGALLLIIWVANSLNQLGYLFGHFTGLDDVTLAQRGYETFKVLEVVGGSPLTLLVGAGPGGYVNLLQSPDVGTLYSSGRDVWAVDDVHLLTSQLLLKLGLAGLVWLSAMTVYLFKLGAAVLKRPRPEPFEVVLLMFAVGGVAFGLPAANNFLANPLPVLLAAVLARRLSTRYVSEATSEGRSASGPSSATAGAAPGRLEPWRRG